MSKGRYRIPGLISSKEGKRKIREVEKRFGQLLEITQCIMCKKKKPLSEFAEDENGYLGFSNLCKVCSEKALGAVGQETLLYKCAVCGEFKNKNFFYKGYSKRHRDICKVCITNIIMKKAEEGYTKRCTRCGEGKPATPDMFRVSITGKDLLRVECRKCENKKNRDRENKRKERKTLNPKC